MLLHYEHDTGEVVVGGGGEMAAGAWLSKVIRRLEPSAGLRWEGVRPTTTDPLGRFHLNSSKLSSANGRGARSDISALARGTRIHTYKYTETHKHVHTYLAVICFPES